MEIIIKAIRWITDAIFPKTCLRCGTEGTWICDVCLKMPQEYRVQGCLICKKGSEYTICRDCAVCTPVSFLFSAYSYADPFVKNIVHALKYQYITDISDDMGRLLARRMSRYVDRSSPDICIIPIPIHAKKYRDRGFNQSELIARACAKELDIPCISHSLKRVVNTQSQVNLSRDDRMQNIAGAFTVCDAGKIQGKVVYLIDDVYTTGGTLLEAARTLRGAGVKDVIGVTFAREE